MGKHSSIQKSEESILNIGNDAINKDMKTYYDKFDSNQVKINYPSKNSDILLQDSN